MAAEQLTLLDLEPEATGPTAARPRARARRAGPAKPAIAAQSTPGSESPAPDEVVIEHRYPQALEFLREHGADAVAVLHVLVAQAESVDGRLVVAASTRGVADQLGFLSKDSAHRRLRQLRRAGVLDVMPSTGPMDPLTYVVHLDATGVTVTHPSG